MIGVRLDKEMEERLGRLARETGRTKSYYVKEAIAEYLAEREDGLLALARLEKAEKPLKTEEVWRALGWEPAGARKKRGPSPRPARRKGLSPGRK